MTKYFSGQSVVGKNSSLLYAMKDKMSLFQSLWVALTQAKDKLQGIQEYINPAPGSSRAARNRPQWNTVVEVSSFLTYNRVLC